MLLTFASIYGKYIMVAPKGVGEWAGPLKIYQNFTYQMIIYHIIKICCYFKWRILLVISKNVVYTIKSRFPPKVSKKIFNVMQSTSNLSLCLKILSYVFDRINQFWAFHSPCVAKGGIAPCLWYVWPCHRE